MHKRDILVALTAFGLLLTGCGRDTGLNPTIMAAGQTSFANAAGTAATNNYLYPGAQPQTTGTAQATPGGRAVATATGYVYEQNPLANNAGYNFYNSQNPCLFPQAGQTSNCSSASGTTSGYYNGQQPGVTGTIYPTAATAGSPSYGSPTGTSAALPPGTTYATPAGSTSAYGSSYATPAGTTYASAAGTTSAYGTATPAGTTNPYGTSYATPAGTTAANPYGTTTSAYGASTSNPYGAATPAANPYGTATAPAATTPATSYASQSASSADKARARIDTSTAASSTSNGKKGPSF